MIMKKILVLFLAVGFFACSNQPVVSQVDEQPVDEGAVNTELYVYSLVDSSLIDSIRVAQDEYVIADIMLGFKNNEMLRKTGQFFEESLSLEDYEASVDTFGTMLDDAVNSIAYGNILNDSLRQLPQYDGAWRKTYKADVWMKDGRHRTIRVVMDSDSITPRCLERDYRGKFKDYVDFYKKCLRYISDEKRYRRTGEVSIYW